MSRSNSSKRRVREPLFRIPDEGICQKMGGKKIWINRAGARQHIRSLRSNGKLRSGEGRLITYHCDHGDHWHVGHATTRDWSINKKEKQQ